jgi:hypothetical protein
LEKLESGAIPMDLAELPVGIEETFVHDTPSVVFSSTWTLFAPASSTGASVPTNRSERAADWSTARGGAPNPRLMRVPLAGVTVKATSAAYPAVATTGLDFASREYAGGNEYVVK